MDTITLADGALTATFLPSLGMVASSLMHDGDQLLDLRGGPAAYAEHSSTFGIPLLHPYANRLSAWSYDGVELDRDSPLVHVDHGTQLPMHGLLAASPYWDVTTREEARLTAEFDFGARPELLALFPFPHRLTYAATVRDDRLTIALTLTATGDVPVPVSFGFHPYLSLPRSDRHGWRIELPVRRRALLDGCGIPSGATEDLAAGALDGRLGARTFDDCFDRLSETRPVRFEAADGRRTVGVEFVSGYTVAQVYAPDGSQFICFEPMTAPVDALRSGKGLRHVAPGESFVAEFAVSVSSPPG